jgi:hypothetical protein
MNDFPCFGFSKKGGKNIQCPETWKASLVQRVEPTTGLHCDVCRESVPARVYQQTAVIHLTDEQLARSAACARLRLEESRRQGLADQHGRVEKDFGIDMTGACGEHATAILKCVPWTASVNVGDAPDVGDIQVRSTNNAGYNLIVRPGDVEKYPNHPYMLAVVQGAKVYLIGWIYAREAESAARPRTHSDENGEWSPAYFVPKSALHPPTTCPLTALNVSQIV